MANCYERSRCGYPRNCGNNNGYSCNNCGNCSNCGGCNGYGCSNCGCHPGNYPMPVPPGFLPMPMPCEYMNAVTDGAQAPGGGTPMVFHINRAVCGPSIYHAPGTGIFTLRPGSYFVLYSAMARPSIVGDTSPMSVALYYQGEQIPGTFSEATPSSAGEGHSLSASAIVEIPPCSASNLSLVNTDPNTSIAEAQITFLRL